MIKELVDGFFKFVLCVCLKRAAHLTPIGTARNYVELPMLVRTKDGARRAVLSINFEDGKTPHELRHEAEDELKDLFQLLRKVQAGEMEIDEAVGQACVAAMGLDRRAIPHRATIDMLQEQAFKNAVEKGWHDEPSTNAEKIALMHSELSEALEELRNGRSPTETYYNPEKPEKPEGVPSELADVVIRVFDFCGYNRVDLQKAIATKMAYNQTRPYRHGGKKL